MGGLYLRFMQVHRSTNNLPAFKNAVITIGTFDGVHLGHQQIIKQLKEEADENKWRNGYHYFSSASA